MGSKRFGYLLLVPAALVVVGFMAYPLFMVLQLAFRNTGGVINFSELTQAPLSLNSVEDVLTSRKTYDSLWLSVVYTGVTTALSFAIGLTTALLLNRGMRGTRYLRPLILLPWAVPGVAASAIFLWILDASYGILNRLLVAIGAIDRFVPWLADPDTAMLAVILPTVWKHYPFFTLTILAALQTIPSDLYESSAIDGANAINQFRWITWPGIRSLAVLAVIVSGLGTFREFDFIFSLTGGGPNNATSTLPIAIYNEAFRFFEFSTASALGIVTIAVAALFVIVAGRQLRKEFF